jgi:peroxiredoxin
MDRPQALSSPVESNRRGEPMRHLLLIPALALLVAVAEGADDKPQPTPEETTLTAVGDPAPDFSVETLAGDRFTLSAQRGKVVLVNWFATWCPPCREEMPHLQKQVWEAYADKGLVMISVAREEKADVVAPFVAKHAVTWTFGLDPEREAYARYAEAFIPRNTLIGPDGRILFQSEGFEMDEFEALIAAIAQALAEG